MSRRVPVYACLNCGRPAAPVSENPHEQEQFCTPWCETAYDDRKSRQHHTDQEAA